MPESRYGAIFDLDGTLVDSFDAHLIAWQSMSSRHGVPITLEHFERHFGRRNEDMLREIWSEAGHARLTDAKVDQLGREKESLFRALVSKQFPAMDGGRELLQALAVEGWQLAVGSSAPIENVDLALDGMRVREMFRAIVSGGDVKEGKPNPECFLLAARRLQLPPDRCVVVEDAPAGIKAARAAGMRCIAITSKGHRPETQRDANLVVRSLRELTPHVISGLISPDINQCRN
ncbi:MAG: beta-phosphoglucomutase family hydrolase [Phycisphaerae bacterium]|nr:beta-phosphoglucomutase family hydrolase [Phycisphaerae bacterium]